MKKRHYNYGEAPYSSHGLMQCSICTKPITQGQYSYYETPDAYISQHRPCRPDDPTWSRLDQEQAERDRRDAEMLADAVAFRSKWGVSDLDELISELSQRQERSAA